MQTYTIKFYHRDEYETDQELFSHTTKDSSASMALMEAESAYVYNNHDRSLINRITIDVE